MAFIYLALVALGLAAGAVHPLAGALAILEASVYLPFVAALGTAFSLSSKSSL